MRAVDTQAIAWWVGCLGWVGRMIISNLFACLLRRGAEQTWESAFPGTSRRFVSMLCVGKCVHL